MWLVAEDTAFDGAVSSSLHRLDAVTLTTTRIGALACAPVSIAIDRAGTLWGLGADGRLSTISTTDARCTPTKYRPGQGGFSRFFMAFVFDGAGESLYAGDDHSAIGDSTATLGLGKIDAKTLKLAKIGKYERGDPQNELPCALAGTGDGRLYAVCVGAEISLVQPTENGRVPLKLVVPHAMGLHPTHLRPVAFWGDALWSFSHPCDDHPDDARCAERGSGVARYGMHDAPLPKLAVSDLGIIVTAATSSTCAPVK